MFGDWKKFWGCWLDFSAVAAQLWNVRRVMAMHLHSARGEFWWDSFSWVKLLRLAEHYGWRPEGTTISESELRWMPDGRWDGNYTTNDGQTIAAADARRLAEALEQALRDVPSEDVIAQHRDRSGGIQIFPNPPVISDLDWFCGSETKAKIREFISYCYAGEFQIS